MGWHGLDQHDAPVDPGHLVMQKDHSWHRAAMDLLLRVFIADG